jgi:hypothetical protein
MGMVAHRPADLAAPPLEATRFLVEAVTALPAAAPQPLGFRDRVVWAVELFDRLDRLDRPAMAGSVRIN